MQPINYASAVSLSFCVLAVPPPNISSLSTSACHKNVNKPPKPNLPHSGETDDDNDDSAKDEERRKKIANGKWFYHLRLLVVLVVLALHPEAKTYIKWKCSCKLRQTQYEMVHMLSDSTIRLSLHAAGARSGSLLFRSNFKNLYIMLENVQFFMRTFYSWIWQRSTNLHPVTPCQANQSFRQKTTWKD